nr:integrase, catalytic region, zinc finger, CCHC-type, peptidase aspartic, catalytic [Tanacetum cinerariifolium]
MDLCGPMRVESINEKKYILVIVDDYYRYTWVYFLRTKDEAPEMIIKFMTRIQKIIQTIHVKFDELTAMDSEHNKLVPNSNNINFKDPSSELSQTLSKEDFDASDTPTNNDASSSTKIIVDGEEAPHIVSTSTKQTLLQYNDLADGPHQEDKDEVHENAFVNPFCTPTSNVAESSSYNHDPSNMHTFCQQIPYEHQWIKAHPLEQILRDLSKLVMMRNKLSTDAEMCTFALTLSLVEPSNIKEAMADHN